MSLTETNTGTTTSRRSAGFLDVEEVLRHWDLGRSVEWQRTPRGNTNHSFFLTTPRGRFIARLSNPRKTEEGMAAEVALLDHLRDRGVAAPRVVPTRSGGRWATVGGALCLVTERIAGEHADPRIPAHLREVGQALARFHTETRDLPEIARPAPGSELPLLLEGPAVLARLSALAASLLHSDELARYRRAAGALAPLFPEVAAALTSGVLSEVLTHGSLGRSAVLFEGDRLTAMLDFERVTYDARVVDLAYVLRSMTRNRAEVGAFFAGRFGELVDAYRKVGELSDGELARIPVAMQAQGLLRVRSKAVNLLDKHETVPQTARDVLRVLDKPMELELARIVWLARHEDELVAAVGG